MRIIRLDNNPYYNLQLKFHYDKNLVVKCNQITGKLTWKRFKYDGVLKSWLFKLSDLEIVLKEFPATEVEEGVYEDYMRHKNQLQEKVTQIQESKATPLEFKFLNGEEPYLYQKIGVNFAIQNKKCGIFDEVRLGKLYQAAGVIYHVNPKNTLVICTGSTITNWQRKLKTLTNYDSHIVPEQFTEGINIINYDSLQKYSRKVEKMKKGKPVTEWLWNDLTEWDLIIVDESHKAKSGKKSIRGTLTEQVCKRAERVILLTGTPRPTRTKDLLPQIRMMGKISEFGDEWRFLTRHCLPGDAPILMGDLTEKAIKDIKEGDIVIGWDRTLSKKYPSNKPQRKLKETEVIGVYKRQSKLQKVILQNGYTVICTPDHKWLNYRSESTRPELEFNKAKAGKIGRFGCLSATKICYIYSPSKNKLKVTDNYKRGYIYGALSGDGHCVENRHIKYHYFKDKKTSDFKEYAIGIGVRDIAIIDRLKEYFDYFGLTSHVRKRSDGLMSLSSSNAETYRFIKAIKFTNKETYRGFLGGIYDTEGSGHHISQYHSKNRKTHEIIRKALTAFNISFSERIDSRGKLGFTFHKGRKGIISFFELTTPVLGRKLKSYFFKCAGRFVTDVQYIKKIIPLRGLHDVYTIETKTGNYVAYGCGSKNCDAKKTRFGWDTNGNSNLEELNEILSKFTIRRLRKDVWTDIPATKEDATYLDLPESAKYYELQAKLNRELVEASEYYRDTYRALAGKNKIERAEVLLALKEDQKWKSLTSLAIVKIEKLKKELARQKILVLPEILEEYLDNKTKVVVASIHKDPVKKLYEMYADNSILITGEDKIDDRQGIIDKFNQDPNIVFAFVTMGTCDVGLDFSGANYIIHVELDWTPDNHTQMSGRILNPEKKEPTSSTYLVFGNTIEDDIIEMLLNKSKDIEQTIGGAMLTKIFNRIMEDPF